jgi:NAD(P)-dependent dehydrogenase (short-subunit alcohol dehydrogenase family)
MNSLSGERRAIVTGAASGIGLAVARRLRREGAKVLAVDINKHGLAEAAATGCETMTADLAKPGERDGLAKAADGIDYLVNAAGIIRLKSIFEFTVEDWREILTINAESTFFLCQAIGPRMRPGGAIVNLSSSSAKLASTIEAAVYAASKSAILSITRSFAYALASRPVRVNAICPGIIDTPMQERVLEDVAKLRATTSHALSEGRNKMVPLGRSASADECAGAIWFLLSDEASYMTGQAMNFTGGLVQW